MDHLIGYFEIGMIDWHPIWVRFGPLVYYHHHALSSCPKTMNLMEIPVDPLICETWVNWLPLAMLDRHFDA